MTIAILSWGYHETLINSLESYKKFGLDKLDEDKVIFFQEYSPGDADIAAEYGYDAFGSPENIGIAEAYKLLAAYASGEFFLFLENDWLLLEDATYAILDGEALLEIGAADLVRYRHRYEPGNPLWTKQFQGREYDRPTHLLDCVHWEEHPEKFTEIAELNSYTKWYRTTAKNANWTNNPHMARTEFIRSSIVPHLGGDNIERDLQSWWQKQDFKVIQGKGLFKHERTN